MEVVNHISTVTTHQPLVLLHTLRVSLVGNMQPISFGGMFPGNYTRLTHHLLHISYDTKPPKEYNKYVKSPFKPHSNFKVNEAIICIKERHLLWHCGPKFVRACHFLMYMTLSHRALSFFLENKACLPSLSYFWSYKYEVLFFSFVLSLFKLQARSDIYHLESLITRILVAYG